MGKIIDGKKVSLQLQDELKQEVARWREMGQRVPKLVVILIGDDSASHVYVKNKEAAAARIGIESRVERLPETTTESALLERIAAYNQDESVDGILVQLPLPKHINEEKVLLAISHEKDVDGFHPLNMGHLFVGNPDKIPCTPYGIMTLLSAYDIDPKGKDVVVVGRSNIVGKPMAQLLLNAGGTVTITHSQTRELKEVTKRADILIVAIGVGEFITGEHVKEGAVVVDVGMNRNAEGKLVGDVLFSEVEPLASYITPVPGGVGPMTIAMLMEQTVSNVRKIHDGNV